MGPGALRRRGREDMALTVTEASVLETQVQAWLEPLEGDDGPCGPDLEYDNAFLELTKAAEGKPETQFERAIPPDWRDVRSRAEALLERSRDLRIALLWMRAIVNLEGTSAIVPSLRLVLGLLQSRWESVHPLPDPDDNDPYARINALAVLPQKEGALGDLLSSRLAHVKGVGDVRLRDIEVAIGSLPAREGEQPYSRDQLARMLEVTAETGEGLRQVLAQAQELLRALGDLMNERFGLGSSADLKPLVDLFGRAQSMLPASELAAGNDSGDSPVEGIDVAESRGSKATLSGSVHSRADALRAIELVCVYLERHEPTNPAQLFLRRAGALLERSFLELLKELAPNALDDVARMVGVDPGSVGESDRE